MLSVIASKLTMFSEKPSSSMTQKAGKIDSGKVIAAMIGGPPVAQEQEHHDHCEDGAFVQRMHRRFVVAERVGDRGVDQLEVDSPGWPP